MCGTTDLEGWPRYCVNPSVLTYGVEPADLPPTMFLSGGWNLLNSLLFLIIWVFSLHSCRTLLSLEKKHGHIEVTSYKLLQSRACKICCHFSCTKPSPIDQFIES